MGKYRNKNQVWGYKRIGGRKRDNEWSPNGYGVFLQGHKILKLERELLGAHNEYTKWQGIVYLKWLIVYIRISPD